MSLIRSMRRQKAVWWARRDSDEYGSFFFAGPVEIDCRWDDKGEEYRDKDNQVSVSNAVVYPDRELSRGDKLMKGEIDSDTQGDPKEMAEAFEIRRFDITPNLRNTENLYTAYL